METPLVPARLLVCVLSLALGVGCRGSSSSASARSCPEKSTVSISISALPNTLDWSASHEQSAQNYPVILAMMHGLTALDDHHRAIPMLAERWETALTEGTPKRQVYTFHLRKDVVWSDGKTKLTAADFVFGWKRALLGADSAELTDILGAEDVRKARETKWPSAQEKTDQIAKALAQVGVVAVDESTLRVTLTSPKSYFPARVAYVYPFFPAPSADLAGKSEEEITRYFNQPGSGKPMVLGAFVLSRWGRASHEVELTANPFDRFSPKEGRVQRLSLTEGSLGALSYEQCAVDFLFMDDPAARKYPPPDMETQKLLSVYWLGINSAKVPLALRRAITHAVDRAGIFAPLGPQVPSLRLATTFLPDEIPGALPKDDPLRKALPTHDPATAHKEITESGYHGEELSLLVKGSESFMPEVAIADGVRRSLEAVGIHIRVVTTANFTNDVKDASGTPRHHLFLKRTGADFAHPETMFNVWKRDGNHYTAFDKIEGGSAVDLLEHLLSEGAGAVSPEDAREVYGRVEELLQSKHAVVVPLFYPNRYYRKRSFISGLGVDPFNFLTLGNARVTAVAKSR